MKLKFDDCNMHFYILVGKLILMKETYINEKLILISRTFLTKFQSFLNI